MEGDPVVLPVIEAVVVPLAKKESVGNSVAVEWREEEGGVLRVMEGEGDWEGEGVVEGEWEEEAVDEVIGDELAML